MKLQVSCLNSCSGSKVFCVNLEVDKTVNKFRIKQSQMVTFIKDQAGNMRVVDVNPDYKPDGVTSQGYIDRDYIPLVQEAIKAYNKSHKYKCPEFIFNEQFREPLV